MHEAIYAALLVREFPAQILLRMSKTLREQPCAVMHGEPPLQRVISVNKPAGMLGVIRGMTKVEVESFPDVKMLRRSLEEEQIARAVLLECAGSFSPRFEDCSEDGTFLCILDTSGTEKLFGPPQALAKNLLARVQSFGIIAAIAISHNFHAAMALVKGTAPLSIRIVSPGKEAAALSCLPLSVLEPTEEQAETLSLWGIRTLAELAALPEKELISRMGQGGKRLRQLARGELPHLLQPVESAFVLEETMELESPVKQLDPLLFAANAMLEQLMIRAIARVLALASITLHLTLEGGALHACTVRLALPSTDRKLWLKLLHLELESHPPQAAVLGLTLKAEPGNTSKMQLGLFSPQLPEPARLDVTLAHVRALVGEGNVGRPVLNDTRSREGFSMEPFRIFGCRASGTAPAPTRLAMRILRPPEAIQVTMQGQHPGSLLFRTQRYGIEQAYGPWIASGEWWWLSSWEGKQWDLVCRAPDGTLLCCCILYDTLRDEWKMAALYD